MPWFEGGEPRSPDETRFLERLRREAALWPSLGIRQQDTDVLTVLTPLYVGICLPELPSGSGNLTTLQAGYWTGGSTGLVLQAEWGDTYLLEGSNSEDSIRLGGTELHPEDAAELLAQWFASQLCRPVERAEWLGAQGAIIANEWRLTDTGQALATSGSWRQRRRPPNHTVTVRSYSSRRN